MTNSLLTNTSAQVALQNLRSVNRDLAAVQNEVATGQSVSNARDNAAIYAVSQVIEADVRGFESISETLNLGESTVAVARTGAEQITDLLQDIRGLVVSAQEENVDRTAIQAGITENINQITSIVSSAQFNGLNLLENGATDVNILASLGRDATGAATTSTITISAQDLDTATGGGLAAVAAIDVDVADPSGALATIDAGIQTAIDAAAAFGAVERRLEVQDEFVSTLIDNLRAGAGALTDADLEAASARLQSLQVQQQLGVQALSIANQAPQVLLGLFN